LVDVVLVLGGEGLAGDTRILDDGTGAFTELAFGNVNLGGRVVGGRAVDSVKVSVVGAVLDVDVEVGVGVGVGGRRLGREAVAGFLARLELARLKLRLTVKLSALGLAVAGFLVNVDFLTVLGLGLGLGLVLLRATALFLVDADLFSNVRVTGWLLLGLLVLVLVLVLVDGGREGFVRLFVTFPSVCLLLR
jgi:hypothetical protein